jgi:hypothetical protein
MTNKPTTVTTQDELDAALAADFTTIHIKSPAGAYLRISKSGNATVRASDNATVVRIHVGSDQLGSS